MAPFNYLQPILGTDKRNPVFSIQQHSQSKAFHVYYGLELFDVVPSDREDTRFKLMVAHMNNVGVSLSKLQEVFGLDPRTILNWSHALKSGSAEKLARALAGRGVNRKLTAPVEHYARIRFASVYAKDRRSYSRTIREEIEQIFEVQLSAETLRPLFTRLRAELEGSAVPDASGAKSVVSESGGADGVNPEGAEVNESDGTGPDEDDDLGPPSAPDVERQVPVGEVPAATGVEGEQGEALRAIGEPLEVPPAESVGAPSHRKQYAESGWCSHLGLLLFASPLASLREALGADGLPVCQWGAQVLLGAANMEQTKLLSTRDLSLLLGQEVLGTPAHQRVKLAQLAEQDGLAEAILRWNFQRTGALGGAGKGDFYFDPHVKHYTGAQKVLKGWCAKIRWADKVLNMDFAHNARGCPVYAENTDNYEDMRVRFDAFQGRLRTTLGIAQEAVLTWVIDRGIYGKENFERIGPDPFNHLVTWEKGYRQGSWPEGQAAEGSMVMERVRNHSGDLKTYRFEWVQAPWAKDTRWRRIIVRATNPENRVAEVGILCDDLERPTKEIVWLMFDRWVQENDFKYLDEHFGLNEITSYQSQSYEAIRGELQDRDMKNARYSALEKARIELKHQLGGLLLLAKEADKKESSRDVKIAVLEALSPDKRTQAQRAELGRLKGAKRSAANHRVTRAKRMAHIEGEIARTEEQMQATAKAVSRIETLVTNETVRLCGRPKRLMDVIKLTMRNLFYQTMEPFKEAYDNFRDDHVWFRQWVRWGGVIEPSAEQTLRCHLVGAEDAPKPVRRAIEKILADFNLANPRLPSNDPKPFELLLAPKSAIQLAMPTPA